MVSRTYIGIFGDSYAKPVTVYPCQEFRDAIKSYLKGIKLNYITSLPGIFAAPDVDTSKLADAGVLPVGGNAYYFRYNGNIEYYLGGIQQYRVYVPDNRELFFSNGRLYAAQKNGDLIKVDKTGAHQLKFTGDIVSDPLFRDEKRKISYLWNNVSKQTFIHLNGNLYVVKLSDNDQAITRLLNTGMDLDKHGVISIYLDEFENIFLGCRTEGFICSEKKSSMW